MKQKALIVNALESGSSTMHAQFQSSLLQHVQVTLMLLEFKSFLWTGLKVEVPLCIFNFQVVICKLQH